MSKVYIVQEPMRVERKGNKVTNVAPVYNYEPARAYGDLEYCLRQGNARFSPRQTIADLKHALKDFGPDDYILPTGDPGIIGVAIALACRQTGGKVKVLRWMRKDQQYLELEYDLNN